MLLFADYHQAIERYAQVRNIAASFDDIPSEFNHDDFKPLRRLAYSYPRAVHRRRIEKAFVDQLENRNRAQNKIEHGAQLDVKEQGLAAFIKSEVRVAFF